MQPFTEVEFSAWKKAVEVVGGIPTTKMIEKEFKRMQRKAQVRTCVRVPTPYQAGVHRPLVPTACHGLFVFGKPRTRARRRT